MILQLKKYILEIGSLSIMSNDLILAENILYNYYLLYYYNSIYLYSSVLLLIALESILP